MAQFRPYPFFIKLAALKYLKKEYGLRAGRHIWRKTLEHYRRFVEEAPALGGRENSMSSNLYMALSVFALYEAVGRSLTPEALKRLIADSVPARIPVVSGLLDFNRAKNQE